MTDIKRPALRYHGAKWLLANWIISYLPQDHLYCEPYAGSLAVLLRKPRSPLEVINDLDSSIVNFFTILRDNAQELIQKIELTPFAKEEYELSQLQTNDPIENARRFYVRAAMSISGPTATWKSGWRRQKKFAENPHGRGGMTAAAVTFANIDHLYDIATRIRGVSIEHDEALNVIKRYDNKHAVFYVDPPYVTSTRGTWSKNAYAHEMSNDNHTDLAIALKMASGAIVLSGYQSDLYNDLYAGWTRVDRVARTNGPNKAIESLWINHKAQTMLEEAEQDTGSQLDLFD